MILGRHAGPGDSFTLVNLILTTFRRRPKVVLKAAMQWDPGIDLLLNRLDCYFLPSTTGAGDDRIDHVARLAASLEDDEALLIFPEGGNWTPKRHERAVRYLLRTGQYERAKEAEEEEHVLPPRPGGVVAALTARPDLDVVVLAHAGLDLLVSPVDIWEAIPVVHQPMSIHWWVAEAGTVPADQQEILSWVDDIWREVDAWVEAELNVAERDPAVTGVVARRHRSEGSRGRLSDGCWSRPGSSAARSARSGSSLAGPASSSAPISAVVDVSAPTASTTAPSGRAAVAPRRHARRPGRSW